MELVLTILEYLKWIFFIYLTFSTFYLLFFALAGLLRYRIELLPPKKFRRIALFLPGYKEDGVIVEVARRAAFEQNYPRDSYEVIVIADSFKPETLERLAQLPIRVIEVSFEVSSKSKALNKAMSILPDTYDLAVVLDADNIMEPEFLFKMNSAFEHGFLAIQGHRTAKNLNTPFAMLDAISEEINNRIFRRGHRIAGFSSALIGSGMAFDYQVFKREMSLIESFGEDKELELNLLEKKIRIEYLEDAWVYDEKIDQPEKMVRQRSRWIANQILYAKSHFSKAFRELFLHRNIDYFEKVVQHFQPPRILLGGLLALVTIISFFLEDRELRYAWLAIFTLYVITMFIALPHRFMNLKTLKIVYHLPKGFWIMLKSLFRVRLKMNSFQATTHSGNVDAVQITRNAEDGDTSQEGLMDKNNT